MPFQTATLLPDLTLENAVDWIVAVCLAVLQGLTEFLPVSSSGHLILPAQLLGIKDQGLAFDAAVHLGSLAAVLHYFRANLIGLGHGCLQAAVSGRQNKDSRLALQLAVATLPIVFTGLFIQYQGLMPPRTVLVVASTTLIFGILLGLADQVATRKTERDLSFGQALLIGCAQILALIPGVSRAGITITVSRFLGLDLEAATRFSFLLGIPAIAGAGFVKVSALQTGTVTDTAIAGAGFVVSLAVSWLSIHFFLGFVGRIGLAPFALYRIGLGLVLLLFFV